jgi:TonB-linked SusC/RagA family outer membrane protein
MLKLNQWRIIILLLILLPPGISLHAQTIEVSGRITDENNQALAGVNVYTKGTTGQGAISDVRGEFLINAELNSTLVFSFIGYKTTEISATSQEIFVLMEPESIEIEEVVAIGYGSVRRKDLSSSISTVQGKDIIKSAPGNFAKGLQGLASGVQVFDTDGRPGSTPTIVIRGATSMSGSTNPIIVVDGIPVGFNANQLNPEDIESVSILKDASATAIYGTQAANGVMLVTTKKGRMGESNFRVTANYGLQQLKTPGVAGAEEYMEIQNLKRFNERPDRGEFQLFSEEEVTNAVSTDWWKKAIRPLAPRYNMNVGFDGGSKKFRYSGNVGYFGQESQMEVGNWDKVTARFNTEYHFSDNVKFGQNFYPRFESWQNTPDIWSLISMDPTTPVYIPEDEQEGKNRYSIYQRSYNNDTYNPMGMIERYKVNNNNLLIGMQTNTYLNIRFLKDFVFNTQLGLNFSSLMADAYDPEYFIHNMESNEESSVSRTVDNFYSFVSNNTLNYLKTINGVHNLNVLIGFVAEKGQTRDVYGYKKGIPNDNVNLRYLAAAENDPEANGNDVINTALSSVLSRVMYNYNEKYYVNFSFRRDGSFKFPEDERYGNFPALSVAWAAHNESFISGVSWISNMKVRAGWGRVGNQKPLQPNTFLWSLGKVPYVLGDNAQTAVGAYSNQFANQEIKWEMVEDLSAGIDMAFLQNKITATLEVYSKKTHDMIMQKEYPFFSGYPNYESQVWSNIGSIVSRGIELELGYHDYRGEFTWSATGNITHFKTRAAELADGIPYLGAWWGDYLTRTIEGELVGQFWGYKTGGLFQNWTDVYEHCARDEDGNPLDMDGNIDGSLEFDEEGKPINDRELLQNKAVPGDVIFLDLNKNNEIEEEDQTFIGSGQPDFTAGVNLRAAFRGFDFSVDLYAAIGADIFNATLWEWEWGADNSNTFSGVREDAWHGEGTSDRIPILNLNDKNRNYWKISDIYIDNGNYLKIRNIQLGYTIPEWRKIKQLRIYVNIDNPFVFTNYRGFEPELYGSVTEQNIDWGGNYPNPTIYSFGLNLSF